MQADTILAKNFQYYYQNQTYPSGMIFDYWACGPAEKANGKAWPGAFPAGFLGRLKTSFSLVWPKKREEIAHICSGRIPKKEGIRVDIARKYHPDMVANVEEFAKQFLKKYHKVRWSITDPPYNVRRAKEYFHIQLLSKNKMVKEMTKITRVGGFVATLDQYSLNGYPRNLKKIAVIAVSSIPNPDLRVFTVWRKIAD